jgi:hypothetical protein
MQAVYVSRKPGGGRRTSPGPTGHHRELLRAHRWRPDLLVLVRSSSPGYKPGGQACVPRKNALSNANTVKPGTVPSLSKLRTRVRVSSSLHTTISNISEPNWRTRTYQHRPLLANPKPIADPSIQSSGRGPVLRGVGYRIRFAGLNCSSLQSIPISCW